MFVKQVSADSSENEVELQTIAARHGFSPKIISTSTQDNVCLIFMENLDADCLADVYGEDPDDIPTWIWDRIRTMVKTLLYEEGIEYIDITPYNFIEKDNRIYMVDFGDAKYTKPNELISWFLEEFIEGENSWNPDYK
jgi:tRNA A-37 threonylcarbamoyl transferase component Bud32